MNLSELQDKEIIDIATGRRIGNIIDVIIDRKGMVAKLLLEDRKPNRRLFNNNNCHYSFRNNSSNNIHSLHSINT